MASIPATLPPGVTLIAVITPSLNLLMIGTVWSAVLVPLLFILFFFSTREIRRQPIFLMNVFAVIMGIVIGIVNMQIYVRDILSPPEQGFAARTLLAYIGMILFLPLFVDCILAYRLYIVYPRRTTPKLLFASIFTTVALFKIARTTNLALFMAKFSALLLGPDTLSAIGNFQQLWTHGAWTKIEWILQIFDNCFASAMFLWKIQRGRKLGRSAGIVHSTVSRSGSDKLKSLFYLALSTFIFPCVFSIAQVIIVFNNSSFFLGAYIFVTNIYLEIIGVLLATVWAAKGHDEGTHTEKSSTQFSSMVFRPGTGPNSRTKTSQSTGAYSVSDSRDAGDVGMDEFTSQKAAGFNSDQDAV